MGILRVYLALCVIAGHSSAIVPWRMHDGLQAVQIFYIISGFYMAMVLSSRYDSVRDFYRSRLLRIFPAYWAVLAGTIVVCVASGLIFHQWFLLEPYVTRPFERNGVAGVCLTALSNLTLVGQDWIMFLQHEAGQSLRPTSDFLHGAHPLWRYLLLPQCWSVGVELTFYALAPVLNGLRSRWLAGIALAALGLRLLAYWQLGLDDDPWVYRFFPFELSLFLLGMLAYRLQARVASRSPLRWLRCESTTGYLIGALAVVFLLYVHARGEHYLTRYVSSRISVLITYPGWAVGIPLLFFAFGNQKIDRLIGELSYPLYLVHFIVVAVVIALMNLCGGRHEWIGWPSVVLSLLLSGVVYWKVIRPVDRTRSTLARSVPAVPPPATGPGKPPAA